MTQSTFSAQVANNLLTLLQGYTKGIRFIALLTVLLALGVGNAWAESVEMSSFSATSADMDNYISYKTAKGGGTSNPAVNDSQIRLYQGAPGGNITISAKEGVTITEVTIGSGMATQIRWEINGTTDASNTSLAKNAKTTKSGISTESITCHCYGSDKNSRLYVNYLKVVYTIDGGSTPDPCTTPTVAWNTKPANGEVGDSMTASVTTNYSNGLTYSSSNQTVATVTNAGVIKYLAAGTTTITATVTGDGTTFCEGPVSVQQEITVTAPTGGDGGDGECSWTLVADASTLKVDDEVIITASGSTTDNNYALSTNQKSNNRGGAAITKNGNTLTAPSADVQILTLKAGSTSGTFAFYTGASGYLYAASSSGNQLKTKTTLDAHGSWTISITDGVASIAATGSSNRNVMQYNYNNGSPLFACYASASQTSLAIYKKICSDDGGGTSTYTITSTLSHVTADGGNPTTITSEDTELELSYSADTDWNLPENITITMGGNELTDSEYVWDNENGDLLIQLTSGFTGNIVVTINGWQQLATPTGLDVPNTTSTSATLSWNEVANASSYLITIVDGGDLSADIPNTQTSHTFKGLTPSTEYLWTVKAIGDGITYTNSKESETAEFTTDAATYTITYVTNGGTKVESTSGTTLPNQLPTTTRDHYEFAGWFTDEGCTQAAEAGATINANTTLYAKWTPITYTVTFDAGSGTCGTTTMTGNFETGLELPTATPCTYAQENGWSFVGWSETTISETTVRPAIHTGNYKPTNTITLHAVYAKTGTAQGAEGEFILSLEYEGTIYYVGQTFDNSKLSAETEQTNAARFTIEDSYLHYEGGYISHVDTNSSPNITKQTDKAKAKAWTIAENGSTITFTSTADETRGLGFNYNDGAPRFAAYKLNEKEKDGETIKYPSTFTKISVSGGNVQVTTYNSKPSCEAPVDPTWVDAQITHIAIKANCGSTTVLGSAGENGPATISFGGTNLQNSVTVTASEGFLVSTYKTDPEKYAQSVIIYPNSTGNNIGKITQNVHVIAQAPAQSGNYTGTITLTGADIPGGSQVINVTAAVTCTQYTITWSVSGDETQKTTFYAGGDWELPENPTFDCNGRVFVGWTNNEIVQPQDFAPNVLYKEQGEFPTIESNTTFYAVFAKKGTDDGSGNSGDTKTVTLPRPSKTASGYQTGTTEDSEGNTWSYYATLNNQSGTYCYGLNSNSNNYHISSPIFGGTIKSISFKAHNGSSSANRKFLFCSSNTTAQPTTGDLAEVTIPKSESFSQIYTADLSQLGVNQFHIYVAAALSITDIAVTYTTGSSTSSTTYTSYTTSCADVKAIRIVEPTTKTFNEGDKFVFDGEVWAINSDGTETNVTNSSLVHFVYDMNKVGTQTVTVSYLGFTATYAITINEVEKWQITWNVSGATNTGLGPKEVAKGTAIDKLPQPKEIPAGCTGKEFRGWTESNTVNSDGSNIEWITEETTPTTNTTYYAVFATNSGEGSGDGNYVKLTDTPADLSGEYLIVYEDAENNYDGAKAFDGGLATLDAASNTISVTINGNTIESTDETDAAKFTIAPYNGGYSIKSASGYFIGQTSYDNDLASHKTTQYINNIAIESSNAIISCSTNSGNVTLKYNKTSGQTRFRYYKTGQQPIALYKKSGSSASYTDYTTGCHDVTITYYGFKGGYTDLCDGSDLNVITQRVNSSHTIPTCTEITDPTTLGRTFLNLWKDQNGKEHKPGDSFIVTENITLYAQWKLETTGNITLPADKEDLATTDIIVTGGKTLTIPEGKIITINSLTLKGGLLGEDSKSGYAMPSVVIPDDATLVRKNTTINFDLVVNNDSWYPFAVPFALDKNDNIDYLDPVLKAASTYNTHFAIKTYDGENRAIVGTDQENNWDKVPQTAGLQPGKGYIISALTYPNKDTATIRIPMNVDNAWLANGEQESITVKETTTTRNAVAVAAHTGAAATEHQRHAGWNFVANPYLSKFAGSNVANDVTYIKGSINIQDKYTYEDTEVTYVTVPAYNFAYYEQFKLSTTKLNPAYSFFVQVGTEGTMTFETAGRQQAPASIAAHNAEERPMKMDVDITLSDNHSSDLTGIIISDRYTDAYEIGRDLEKLFGSAYNLSVYTLMADNTPLAFQALAIRSNMQVIPVGYRAPEQGEYTFHLNETTSSIDLLNEQYEQLVLVDYETGELTNLLVSDYTFYSERTQADNRFALYAVPRQNAPTDLPNALGQDKEAQKIIHNGHLYILRDGNVYNGNGQMVK